MTAIDAVVISNSQAALLDLSIVAARSRLLDTPYSMAPDINPDDPPVYKALIRLKPDDLSLGRWAEKAGLARNYFNGLRKHGNPNEAALSSLLDVIRVGYVEFQAAREVVQTEVVSAGAVGAREVRREYFGQEPLPPLPLLGSAMGGEYPDIDAEIELIELHLGEVLAYVARPQYLAKEPDAYSLTIVGDSMRPRFKPGEQVAVSVRSPVSIGDDVIVQLRGLDGDEERIKSVLIKELVKVTASFVELRQWNPEITFRVDRRRVAAMHKVRLNFGTP